MEDPYSIEYFLKEQPQCIDLTGDALENAYQKWLHDIYLEMQADDAISRMKEQDNTDGNV